MEGSLQTKPATQRWIQHITTQELEELAGHCYEWRQNYNTVARQRLVKWDTRRPKEVFTKGLRPTVDLSCIHYSYTELIHKVTDLEMYATTNTPSVFVSTTREKEDRTLWTPNSNRGGIYGYEIYAPGGIDVAKQLGTDRFSNKHEIAFFGGIRSEFILGAIELDSQEGEHQILYHRNPNFIQYARGAAVISRFCRTPVISSYHSFREELSIESMGTCSEVCGNYNTSTNSWSTTTTDDPMRLDGLYKPILSCLLWYKIIVHPPKFFQQGKNTLAIYGDVKVRINSGHSVELWSAKPSNKLQKESSQPTCKLVALRSIKPLEICIEAHVKKYNPWMITNSDDEAIIADGRKCSSSGNTISVPGQDGHANVVIEREKCVNCEATDDCEIYFTETEK